ncbi:MAG TPA: glucose 1-dehydrogenase [Gaiellales bacterium]|jgi:NAD(P)-dependent dehydrogenase (short-subunit alcohol dehydrogenase family)|nr:glucose 1-dehydrogenase [Gaiellales bacterium]
MRLADRVAIVTGGAQGIGRAIAQRLHQEGATVVIADLQGHEAAAEELDGLGVRVDVSSEADTKALAVAVLERYGRIDALVNNAGIYSSLVPTPFEEIEVDEWRRVYDVNVLGMFLCTRAVTPAMREAGYGRIVNIASGTPYKGVPFLLHYVTSKGAVITMTRAVAKEVAGDGILVNTVSPGFTMSDGVLANPVQVEKLQEISLKARLVQRDQFPSDIVGAVAFFCSPDADFITGQSLVVDGGAYFN